MPANSHENVVDMELRLRGSPEGAVTYDRTADIITFGQKGERVRTQGKPLPLDGVVTIDNPEPVAAPIPRQNNGLPDLMAYRGTQEDFEDGIYSLESRIIAFTSMLHGPDNLTDEARVVKQKVMGIMLDASIALRKTAKDGVMDAAAAKAYLMKHPQMALRLESTKDLPIPQNIEEALRTGNFGADYLVDLITGHRDELESVLDRHELETDAEVLQFPAVDDKPQAD